MTGVVGGGSAWQHEARHTAALRTVDASVGGDGEAPTSSGGPLPPDGRHPTHDDGTAHPMLRPPARTLLLEIQAWQRQQLRRPSPDGSDGDSGADRLSCAQRPAGPVRHGGLARGCSSAVGTSISRFFLYGFKRLVVLGNYLRLDNGYLICTYLIFMHHFIVMRHH